MSLARTNLNQLQTNEELLFQICNSMSLAGENPAGLQTNAASRAQLFIILWATLVISIPRYVDVSKYKKAQKGQSATWPHIYICSLSKDEDC